MVGRGDGFFDVRRSRAWVLTRRIAHTAHHRGQQLAMLRMLGRDEHSNYGPTADTGGLMQNHAPTIYPYPNLQALFEGETAGGRKSALPGPGTEAGYREAGSEEVMPAVSRPEFCPASTTRAAALCWG